MIEQFQNYLIAIKGYSKHTAKAYGKDLANFARHMSSTRADARWSSIERADIDAYVEAMTEEGKTPATINRHISSIRALFDYFKRQGWLKENPARYMTLKKITKTIPNTIAAAELEAAMEHATGTVRIWIILLAKTGIRIQELLDMQRSDIEDKEGRIKINGKGSKQRFVYLEKADMEEVTGYFAGRPHAPWASIDQRNARRAIYEHMRRYSSARQLSPHAIRHTYATLIAKNGAPATTIAKLMGHESIQTTQKYIDMAKIETRQQALAFSPW